jgi:hypothetical protein
VTERLLQIQTGGKTPLTPIVSDGEASSQAGAYRQRRSHLRARHLCPSTPRGDRALATAGDQALLCLETFWRNGRWHELFPHAKLTSPVLNHILLGLLLRYPLGKT